jgi:hypothetical protein
MNGDHIDFAQTPGDEEALKRARMATLAELRRSPVAKPWHQRAWLVVGGVLGLTAVAAMVVAVLNWPVPAPGARVPGVALLLAAQLLGLFSALAPGRSRLAEVSWVLAAAGALAVLAGRALGATAAEPAPGWICSVTELLAGVAPLALVLAGLRDIGWSWRRAVTAGVALGAAGFIWGQVACERGLPHVLLHHGGAWLALAAACVYLSRRLRPRSFAP